MSYLQLSRSRRLIAAAVVSCGLLALLPEIDIRLSEQFFGGARFDLASTWWAKALHQSVGYFIGIAGAALVGIYCFNRVKARRVLGVDGKVLVYLALVLTIGSGLIVNFILKDGFGRARPRNIVEFGGVQEFSPAFVLSDSCWRNCSFSSGDSSGAFFAVALALALSRKRRWLLAAGAYGGIVSFSRIAVGAHFLSDTLVSFFVMVITADALYHYLLAPAYAAEATPEEEVRHPELDPVVAGRRLPPVAAGDELGP